eukprot:144708_1
MIPHLFIVWLSIASSCDEILTGSGTNYTGCQDTTVNCLTCQKWTEQSPHSHSYSSVGDHNYCRNPSNSYSIWCYTTDPDVRWAFCIPSTDSTSTCVSTCNEELVGNLDSGYRGCQDRTTEGYPCQNWSSQTPHDHSVTASEYPSMGVGNHNYCRNPDGASTIWCYTTDPDTRWEYCLPMMTSDPTTSPTLLPTATPTTDQPTISPISNPTGLPSAKPSVLPTSNPTNTQDADDDDRTTTQESDHSDDVNSIDNFSRFALQKEMYFIIAGVAGMLVICGVIMCIWCRIQHNKDVAKQFISALETIKQRETCASQSEVVQAANTVQASPLDTHSVNTGQTVEDLEVINDVLMCDTNGSQFVTSGGLDERQEA